MLPLLSPIGNDERRRNMLYDVTHSCGHVAEYDMRGMSSRDRDWRIRCLERQPCEACQLEAVMEWGRERGLPDMTGSEKQVAWAAWIRKSQIQQAERAMEEARRRDQRKPNPEAMATLAQALENIQAIPEAKWWIDHREKDIFKEEAERLKKEASVTPAQMKAEEAAILEPTGDVSPTLCVVSRRESSIWVKSDYDPRIPPILKAIGMQWDPMERSWWRHVGEKEGPIGDRMAEAANHLLAHGYPVRLDPSLHQMAIEGSFLPEQTRWVDKSRKEEGKLAITWHKGDPIERKVSSLEWASMRKGGAIVQLAAKGRLLDFMELHGFVATNAAQAMLDGYQPEAVRVIERKRQAAGDEAAAKLEAILESSRDVLEDLKDED